MPSLQVMQKLGRAVFSALVSPPTTHRGVPTPRPVITDDIRYPEGPRISVAANRHGEVEILPGGVPATHWFIEASGVSFHVVTAGEPRNEAVVLLHGLPESWWAWHRQMAALAEHYYVVCPDLKGYGQSDKRVELDYRHETLAEEMAELIDALGIDRFNLGGHDRGTVVADHLLAVQGMRGRVLRYVRMQQTAVEPHSPPVPPHHLFASPLGRLGFKASIVPRMIYESEYVTHALPEAVLERLEYEWKFEGTAEAVSKYFETTSFEQELHDRHKRIFKYMTMPVLFLQGARDPGQWPSEYHDVPTTVPTGRVEFIDAGHFFHLERPDVTNDAILRFLRETPATDSKTPSATLVA